MDTVASCACATVARPASTGAHSSAARRPRRRTRAGEDTKLSEEEPGRWVSERLPADAEDSGGEASGRELSRAEDASEAIRRSGDPAIRRSGDYSEGNPLRPCQPLRETIFRAPGGGRKRCTQRADRMPSFVEDGHRDLSEPVARLARAAHTSAKHHLFRLTYRMPNTQRRQVSRVLESQRALASTRRRDALAGIGRHSAAGLNPDNRA